MVSIVGREALAEREVCRRSIRSLCEESSDHLSRWAQALQKLGSATFNRRNQSVAAEAVDAYNRTSSSGVAREENDSLRRTSQIDGGTIEGADVRMYV